MEFIYLFSSTQKQRGGTRSHSSHSPFYPPRPHIQSWNRITQFKYDNCQRTIVLFISSSNTMLIYFSSLNNLILFLRPLFLTLYNWSTLTDSGAKFLQILGWEKVVNKGDFENSWKVGLKREPLFNKWNWIDSSYQLMDILLIEVSIEWLMVSSCI